MSFERTLNTYIIGIRLGAHFAVLTKEIMAVPIENTCKGNSRKKEEFFAWEFGESEDVGEGVYRGMCFLCLTLPPT